MILPVPDSWGTALQEFNDCHNPAGPGGGQFCSKGLGHDAFVPAPSLQRRVPRTAADAAYVMGKGYVQQAKAFDRYRGYDIGMKALRDGYERDAEGAEKNWLKHLKSNVEKVRPEVFQAVEDAIAWNEANAPRFMRVVGRYGPDGVVAVTSSTNPNSPFSGDMAAQRVGAVSVVVDSVWFNAKSMARRDAPTPGEATAESFGGMAAALRHEYGHYVWENMKRGWVSDWRAVLPPRGDDSTWGDFPALKDKLTLYSAQNEREAFSEAFAIWTDPKFDRARFPPDVHPIFDYMDRKFGGRVLEARR